jgi:hypothetical protein
MKVKSNVKAGGIHINHNQTVIGTAGEESCEGRQGGRPHRAARRR